MAEKVHRSKIENTEWGIVIGVLILIDIAQILLDLLAIGVGLNRVIDVLVGMGFSFYLHVRGEKMSDPKRLMGVIATFGLEFIPVVDAFPLWSLDGAYNFFLARKRNKEADKQAAAQAKLEKEMRMQKQQQRIIDIQEMRQRQEMQRNMESNMETNQNSVPDDDEELYEDAA